VGRAASLQLYPTPMLITRTKRNGVLATILFKLRGSLQKFPDWPPGARTANGTVLCHYVQLFCETV
jgi:hypothetical protein